MQHKKALNHPFKPIIKGTSNSKSSLWCHFQIGITPYLELFRRKPESLKAFPFLRNAEIEELEFLTELRSHGIRVYGILSMLIGQVIIFT